jgi:preprotein translocase subunit SecA
MFVDLMNDIYHTFTERFLRVQLVFSAPPGEEDGGRGGPPGNGGPLGPGPTPGGPGAPERRRPTKRFNALGILEDIPPEEADGGAGADGDGGAVEEHVPVGAVDVGPAEPPKQQAAARPEPTVVGAGRARSLNAAPARTANVDWSTVGRNDPCPCGSGKKFKKCHGAQL